ncbi:hypothetical protein J6590_067685 [Homalodisca vitripennis]|nr:hypothetical protein J6590_067685 [Homalodisca vitripennis]
MWKFLKAVWFLGTDHVHSIRRSSDVISNVSSHPCGKSLGLCVFSGPILYTQSRRVENIMIEPRFQVQHESNQSLFALFSTLHTRISTITSTNYSQLDGRKEDQR